MPFGHSTDVVDEQETDDDPDHQAISLVRYPPMSMATMRRHVKAMSSAVKTTVV